MAAIASQVVLHPVVSQSLKMGHTTVGRDKVRKQSQMPLPHDLTYAVDIPCHPILREILRLVLIIPGEQR